MRKPRKKFELKAVTEQPETDGMTIGFFLRFRLAIISRKKSQSLALFVIKH